MHFNAENGCKIVTCNVAGLTKEKIPHYRQLFEDVDVLCLQETHGKRKEITKTVQSLGFKKGVFSLASTQAKGVAILWRDPIEGGENI